MLSSRLVFPVLLFISCLPLNAQQSAAIQQPGGPNSGPAPAPPVLTGDALQHPGVPVGKLSEKLTLRSQIYDGMLSDYWIYVPAQYDPNKSAAVMVFQDGFGYLEKISQPTLVVNGHTDIVIATVNSFILQQHIPSAQLILYPDSGHGSHFQYPQLFMAQTRLFLDA